MSTLLRILQYSKRYHYLNLASILFALLLVCAISACGNTSSSTGGSEQGNSNGTSSGSSSNWTTRTSVNGDNLNYINWTGNQFIAVSLYGGLAISSTDGSSWTALDPSYKGPWIARSVISTGSGYVAIGNINLIETSSDGSFWNTTSIAVTGGSSNVNSVTWNRSTNFVAVGNTGTIIESPDGNSWTLQTSGAQNNLNGVIWTGSKYIVVGDSGTILTSIDGSTWTAQSSGTQNNLRGIASTGPKVVAVGDNGTILISTDGGSTWATQSSGTQNNLNGVASNGPQIVAVGDHGTILTSS